MSIINSMPGGGAGFIRASGTINGNGNNICTLTITAMTKIYAIYVRNTSTPSGVTFGPGAFAFGGLTAAGGYEEYFRGNLTHGDSNTRYFAYVTSWSGNVVKFTCYAVNSDENGVLTYYSAAMDYIAVGM